MALLLADVPVQPDGPAADGRLSWASSTCSWPPGRTRRPSARLIGRWLAILLAVNAAIGAYYYLRLVALMFLEPAEHGADEPVHVELGAVAGGRCSAPSLQLSYSSRRSGCGTALVDALAIAATSTAAIFD